MVAAVVIKTYVSSKDLVTVYQLITSVLPPSRQPNVDTAENHSARTISSVVMLLMKSELYTQGLSVITIFGDSS